MSVTSFSSKAAKQLLCLFILKCVLVDCFNSWHNAMGKGYISPFQQPLGRDSINSLFSGPILSRYMVMSTKSGNTNVKKQMQDLITDTEQSRLKIGGQRWILPGDYVVHSEYGVGRYLGIRMVDVTPARPTRTLQPTVEVEYADGEVSWFARIIEKELWLYRSADAGDQELSSLIDRRKWRRRKQSVEDSSKNMAVNLSKMKAIRDAFHRTPCTPDSEKYLEFENSFMFEPTEDQEICFKTIAMDMINNTRPMDRLVCGDVGFGKTEVAIRAIYRAVLSNKQVAFLAPTRVLALQHLRVLRARMPDINVQLLRGGGKGDALKVKEMIKNGECQVVVGTHALLQPTVTFTNLGLLVIDEEQRFGVAHKEKLKAVSGGTDVLTLSATPIPRTLQMSMANLRDLSLMNTAPVGRKEVSVTVSMEDDDMIKKAIEKELERNGQIFVVVPFVSDVNPTHMKLKGIYMYKDIYIYIYDKYVCIHMYMYICIYIYIKWKYIFIRALSRTDTRITGDGSTRPSYRP
jgi:transcription-repair coupling factor (superfamily II helicase)